MTLRERLDRLRDRLGEPRDLASLAALRFLFGALLCVSTIRFVSNGWVDRFYVQPSFHFHYWGFEWVEVLPPEWMYGLHYVMVAAALCVAIGLFYRVACVALFAAFTYVELIDLTNYLNHYYLVSLLALLLCFLPLHRSWSVDAWRSPSVRAQAAPAWVLYLVRFQVGVVYLYAGLAKASSDWLLSAQPLGIWLAARAETPVIGPLFAMPEAAYVMSWAGFLHDVLIVPLLLWRRTRPFAFGALLVFHFFTHVLFDIGIFPFLMPIAATVFFAPEWPRRLVGRFRRAAPAASVAPAAPMAPVATPRPRTLLVALLAAWCAVQVALPLRAHLYAGDVIWHEQGMRWSWRVMLREKNGSVTFRVRSSEWPRERLIAPRRYLTSYQEREMAGQPDMILQLAHRIADDFRAQGVEGVQVRADALVSLNGRPPAPLIDPDVDLATVDDGISAAGWILPAPDTSPLPVLRRPALVADRL